MTLQELNILFEKRKALKENMETLAHLRSASAVSSPAPTGMPHTTGIKDRVSDLAIEIVELEKRIDRQKEEIEKLEVQVIPFIDGIEIDQTRLIFRLRFLHAMSWAEVADAIGGKNTEDGVKRICYRYLALEPPIENLSRAVPQCPALSLDVPRKS